jgi:hypothetical protein
VHRRHHPTAQKTEANMSKLTRNWLIGMVAGWSLLIYGWTTTTTWAIGAALFMFLMLSIERYHNWSRMKNGA